MNTRSRVQLALNVADLDAAVAFYSAAFATKPHKRRPGYANFEVLDPPLKLVLFEAGDAVNRLNHLGVEVADDAAVAAAAQRLDEDGREHELQNDTVCCFARQNKVVTTDPDGTMVEWYRITDDDPQSPPRGACC